MTLQKFNVTVRRFNPTADDGGEDFILPVDCPDAEHAASAAMSNALAWTPKVNNGTVLPVAFRCMAVEPRMD